jgi:membrane-bound lytic murein transglycosylase D
MKNRLFVINTISVAALAFSLFFANQSYANDDFFNDQKYFWQQIYTRYDSDNYVFHDKMNMRLIYKVIQITQEKNQFIENILVKETLKKEVESLKIQIANIKKIKDPSNDIEKSFSAEKIDINKLSKKQLNLYLDEIRYQRGQKNFIEMGFNNLALDHTFIKRLFTHYDVPAENMVISILESSYNDKAESKVGALGVWQMMDTPSKVLFGKFTNYEPRLNRYISSLGAAIILSENKLLLKNWDLAISAYNSGISHYLKFLKRHKKDKNISLSQFINEYSHSAIGFAARNFYAEFLALRDIYHQKVSTFPTIGHPNILKIITCKTSLKEIEKHYLKSGFDFKANNPQFLKGTSSLSPGMIYYGPEKSHFAKSKSILSEKKNYRPLKILSKSQKCR